MVSILGLRPPHPWGFKQVEGQADLRFWVDRRRTARSGGARFRDRHYAPREDEVARLVPPKAAFDRQPAREAARGIREMSKGVTLGDLKLKDMIDEGRL
jgi:hypothetical protein